MSIVATIGFVGAQSRPSKLGPVFSPIHSRLSLHLDTLAWHDGRPSKAARLSIETSRSGGDHVESLRFTRR
jgi:hypothetical protein